MASFFNFQIGRGFMKSNTILLVDPDQTLHLVIGMMFHDIKNCVIESACSGWEAIEKAKNLKGKIDLLVQNLTLPDMSGYELYTKLQDALSRDALVVFQTGMLSIPQEIKELVRAEKAEILHKPYSRAELFTIIGKLMLKFEV